MLRVIEVVLTAHSGSLRTQLTQAAHEVDRFGRKVTQANKGALSSSKLMAAGMAVVGVTVAAGLSMAVGKAMEFETQMRNVNSISHMTEAEFRRLGGSVLDLSRKLPQSASTLASGLYDIASSGFQGAAGLEVLKASAEAASAGLTDTATSSQAITAVLNAYGLGAEHARDVSDTLFQTVNLGVVSFGGLSGVIGDVVGTAAAAGVSIDQVGSAIATMTLSGISANEAGTSLNRMLQSLIQPSDQLATLYKHLGINITRDLKDPAIGLHGVMEQLRVATGGNITTLLQLFPEIRAARGALALLSKEGQNYNRVAGEIEDTNRRQGATQAALKEQMKAAGAQFQLLRNRAEAVAIQMGTRLLPVALDLVRGIEKLGRSAMPTLRHGFEALRPLMRNVVQIGGDLVDIARALYERLGPVGKAMAGIAAGAILGSLTALSSALSSITGFLADHQPLVVAVASAYGLRLVGALVSTAVALGSLALDKVAFGLYAAAGAADRTAASFMTMRGALAGLATLGVAAIMFGVTSAVQKASKGAKDLVESLGVPPNTIQGLTDYRDRISDLELEQGRLKESSGGVRNAIWGMVQQVTPMGDSIERARKEEKELEKQHGATLDKLHSLKENYKSVADATGLSTDAVEDLAVKLGVDLTKGYSKSGDERQKLLDHIRTLERQTGLTGQAMADATGVDIEKMEQLAEAVKKAGEAVEKSFGSATDVISHFDPDAPKDTAKALKDAQEQAEDAHQALVDLQERQRLDRRKTVSDSQELRRARDREREANEAVAEAQRKVVTSGSQISTFYREQIDKTSRFANDLRTATSKGLDPQFIARLLESGPEQAAPLLQTIVSDHSGTLLRIVNDSEAKLREINRSMVEMSRLTTLAMNSANDQMTTDLGAAMNIAAAKAALGTQATVQRVAEQLHLGVEEVRRIGAEFGIALTEGMSVNIDVSVNPLVRAGRAMADGGILYFQTGGLHESHIAHIATGPTRVYNEPETGGEAYIPMGASKRGRSLRILGEVAQRFGYSLVPSTGTAVRSVPSTSVTTTNTYGGMTRTMSVKNETNFHGNMVMTDPKAAENWAKRQRRLAAMRGEGG